MRKTFTSKDSFFLARYGAWWNNPTWGCWARISWAGWGDRIRSPRNPSQGQMMGKLVTSQDVRSQQDDSYATVKNQAGTKQHKRRQDWGSSKGPARGQSGRRSTAEPRTAPGSCFSVFICTLLPWEAENKFLTLRSEPNALKLHHLVNLSASVPKYFWEDMGHKTQTSINDS